LTGHRFTPRPSSSRRSRDARDPNRSSNKFDMSLSIFFANKSFRFGNRAPRTIAI
jgi:hypothetical protein